MNASLFGQIIHLIIIGNPFCNTLTSLPKDSKLLVHMAFVLSSTFGIWKQLKTDLFTPLKKLSLKYPHIWVLLVLNNMCIRTFWREGIKLSMNEVSNNYLFFSFLFIFIFIFILFYFIYFFFFAFLTHGYSIGVEVKSNWVFSNNIKFCTTI